MPYDVHQHRHNFGVWAAARGTQRNFTNITKLQYALEQCGVREFLETPGSLEISASKFEDLHRQWCDNICITLKAKRVRKIRYGRAAKLIALYLKAMVVVGGNADTPLGRVIHPPVDRRLMRGVADSQDFSTELRTRCRSIRWTQLKKTSYYSLIQALRSELAEDSPFWRVEEYWTPADED